MGSSIPEGRGGRQYELGLSFSGHRAGSGRNDIDENVRGIDKAHTYGAHVFVSHGDLQMPFALLSSFLGAALGITVSYGVGSKWGLPLLLKVGPYLHITPKKLESSQKLFDRYGAYVLLIGFFLPGVRHITAYLAGMASMDFRKFAGFAYIGAFLWSMTFLMLGRALEKEWLNVAVYIRHYGFTFVLIGAAVGIVVYLCRRGRPDSRVR